MSHSGYCTGQFFEAKRHCLQTARKEKWSRKHRHLIIIVKGSTGRLDQHL